MRDLIASIDQKIIDLSAFKLYPVPAKNRLKVNILPGFNQFNYKVLDVI